MDFGSYFLSPIAFLILGYRFGKWPGAISHLATVIIAYQLAKPVIKQYVEDLGNRGASYAWPHYLPGIYLVGVVISIGLWYWQKRRGSA